VEILPTVKAWVRYAKFEMQHNDVTRARTCYERALEALGDDGHTVRGTAQHSTAQHSTAQHSTAQHSTAQHSTAQHSTAQHSTAQHSPYGPLTHAPGWPTATAGSGSCCCWLLAGCAGGCQL
jgi:hypothetical protein